MFKKIGLLLRLRTSQNGPPINKRRVKNLCASPPGTTDWLIGKEIVYGGLHTNIKRNRVSPFDPRSKEEIERGGMIGGDRMYKHGYSPYYSKYINPFLKKNQIVLVETGILRGTGLAIWCDLFPTGRIIGLDIDLSHYKSNMDNLRNLGAFSKNIPELHEFDQFVDNERYLRDLLRGNKIDICIDDGMHFDEPVMMTFKSMLPHLSNEFVYFIEDNASVGPRLTAAYPQFEIKSFGELTIVKPKQTSNRNSYNT